MAYIAGQTVVDTWGERGAVESSGLGYVQLFRLLPPRRGQRLSFARLARLIQRLDSPAVALLISMLVTLGHRHRLMAGEVVDLLDGDPQIQ